MMFWILSLLIVLAAGAGVLWPVFQQSSQWKMGGLAVLLALPMATYWLYLGVGQPQALSMPSASPPGSAGGEQDARSDLNDLTAGLRKRLEQSPDDFQGWVLLGRSYKAMQRYPEALAALETARSLAPNDPLVTVEWVEARLYASGEGHISEELTGHLEQAVAADPGLQKGLWLLSMAASQRGDDAAVIKWGELLIQQLDPSNPVAATVRKEIDAAKARLGQTSPPPTPAPATTTPPESAALSALALQFRVELSGAAATASQSTLGASTLYLIVRAAGQGSGPPLGARRITGPSFPLDLTISDKDSMLPQRPISSAPRLQVQARLSASGQAVATAGDWQSAAVTIDSAHASSTTLLIDQRVE